MDGSVAMLQGASRQTLLAGVRRTAEAAAAMSGAPKPDIALDEGGLAVVNDAAVVARTEAALKAALGADKVLRVPPITASEDFSAFIDQGIPSMFFFIGVYDPKVVAASKQPGARPLPVNHSPLFAPAPEPSIETGVKAMSVAVLTALAVR